MVQSGPEGLFRQIVKPQSKRLRRRGVGRPRGAMGAPPPKYTVDMGGHRELVDPLDDNPQLVSPVDQVFVRDKNGKEAWIRLYPNMRADQVRSDFTKAGVGEMEESRLHCAEASWTHYTQLLRQVWPNVKIEEGEPTPAGVHPSVPGTADFVVNTSYFRAVAKIAFHYYLAHSHRGQRGDEACFDDVRHFILEGGDAERFFKESQRPDFAIPFGELPSGGVLTPTQWCHVLAASECGGQGFAYVQLFVGRGHVPRPHYVLLGQWSSPIVVPKSVWGHVYLYDNPQQPGRYAGRVEEANVTRLRKR